MNRRQVLLTAAGSLVLKGQKEFEVASIKPSAPGGQGFRMQFAPGGRVTASNVTVSLLIQQAYGVRAFQIQGAPGWIGSDHYDITTVAEGNPQPDDLGPMMQALLADRFKLALHRETKELPVYALVVAKGGSKLQASTSAQGRIRMGRGQFDMQKGKIETFASELGRLLGRTVIDRTELAGEYDFKLAWTPDEAMARPAGGESAAPADGTGPSIFTALQEQLGLKLESTKGPVEILVIDRVEKASGN